MVKGEVGDLRTSSPTYFIMVPQVAAKIKASVEGGLSSTTRMVLSNNVGLF